MRRLVPTLSVIVLTVLSPLVWAAEAPRSAPVVPRLMPAEPRAAAPSKIDTALARAATAADPLAAARKAGFRVRDDRIQVYVIVREGASADVMSWLESQGASWISTYKGTVQAHVTSATLRLLGQQPEVLAVRRPAYVQPAGRGARAASTTFEGTSLSEGVDAMNAEAWHQAGLTGEGVKVGVIDVGFGGYQSLVGTELPGSGRTTFEAFGASQLDPSIAYGTASAEVVTDVAPGIDQLCLALIETEVDRANAVQWMSSNGVRVISHSVGFLSGPGDGGQAPDVEAFVNAGGLWVNAAGDSRTNHWQGTWVDQNQDGFLEFAGPEDFEWVASQGQRTWLQAGSADLGAFLVWNQWSQPNTDLDLYLYRWDGVSEFVEIVTSSTNLQTGLAGQLPLEYVQAPVLLDGYYGFGVAYNSGPTDVDIELFTTIPVPFTLQFGVEQGSLLSPADNQTSLSVAALDAGDPYPLEPYSSAGPTNGPGGSLAGGITKPDIAGFANVSTATYGPRSGASSFNGTTPACSHVAGAAALVWSAHPDWTNAQVRAFLESRAVDMGPAGKDNDTGYGRLDLGDPPQSDCTYSLSPTDVAVAATGGNGQLSVTTAASCSWTASSSDSWLTVTAGSSGLGDGSVSYDVAANPTSDLRTGSIMVADQQFTVSQAGQTQACSYTLSPSSVSVVASGGTGQFLVSTASSCSWTAPSADSWVIVTAGSSGQGDGSVSWEVTANATSDPRTGSIIVADQQFTVSQAGQAGACSYTLSPSSVNATADGGPASFSVSTTSSCSWTATPSVSWISITAGASGAGNGTVSSQISANPDTASRTGSISVEGVQFGVTQAGHSGSCSYSLTPTQTDFPAEGGEGQVLVSMMDASCSWTSTSQSAWITIVENPSATGPKVLRFRVDPNTGAARTGSFLIAGESLTITQAAGSSGGPEPYRHLVAGVAHTSGAGGSQWRTAVGITNTGANSAQLIFTYRSNLGVVTKTGTIGEHATEELDDVVVGFLGVEGSSSGSLEITSDAPLHVTARTYNQSSNGTFGQFLPGCQAEDALTTGQRGVLQQLKKTDAFRTNIGFVNLGTTICEVIVRLYSRAGEILGNPIVRTVPPGEWTQENDAFSAAEVPSCELGYAIVEVTAPGCSVWAYASVVDNLSGDPTTIPVMVEGGP